MDIFDLEGIDALLDLLARADVGEFEIVRGEKRLSLKRGCGERVFPPGEGVAFDAAPADVAAGSRPDAGSQVEPVVSPSPAPSVADTRDTKDITSPVVGTFYRRPAVEADPYVEVGDYVKKGQVLCIVEAMKLMNEIESTVDGRIVEICLEDAQMVEYGEVLFRVEV